MIAGILVLIGLACAVANKRVTIQKEPQQISIDNGFVKAVFNTSSSSWMSELYGDFKGTGAYGENLLAAGGLRLERENADGSISSGANGELQIMQYITERYFDDCQEINFPRVLDDSSNPTVEESWKFTLCVGDRTLRFESFGSVLSAQSDASIRSIRHALYSTPLSTTAFFDKGVVQIMSAKPTYSHFASSDRLSHAYMLGGVGAIDILRPKATGGEHDQVVLLNSVPNTEGIAFTSGFREILVGTFSHRDYWVEGSSASDAQVPPHRQKYIFSNLYILC